MATITLKDGRFFDVDVVTLTELMFTTENMNYIMGVMTMAENGELDGYTGEIDGQITKCWNHYDHITITSLGNQRYYAVLAFKQDETIYDRIASLESENEALRGSLEYAQAGRIMLGEDDTIGGGES